MRSIRWLLLCSIAVIGCDSSLEVKTKRVVDVSPPAPTETETETQETESRETSTSAAKLTMEDCIDPVLENVPSNVTFTRCNGKTAHGLLDLSGLIPNNLRAGVTIAGVAGNVTPSPVNCGDGDTGCVVQGPTFKAITSADLISNHIKHNVTIGGVTGNYAPPCSADGGVSCFVDGTDYKAAKLANFVDSDVKTGVTIAGVPGSASFESHSPCNSDGDTDCVANASYKAADMSIATAGNIKSGVTIAGVNGGYPSTTHRLEGADGTADLDAATFNAKIKSSADFEWFDSAGARYAHAGEPNIAAGLILNGVSIFGTVGTFVPNTMSVSNLSATIGSGKVALSWTRSGGSGAIIVRRASASVSFTPSHGVNYSPGYSSGGDEIIYKGTAATLDDTDVVSGTTYYYQAFVYGADNAYSPASNEASVPYTEGELCGDLGNSCYDNSAAIAVELAVTPSGKKLEYVTASGAFKVWKEVDSNKILRANGLDEWAKKLNLDGKGLSGTDFTNYTSIAGRVCPPNVYIDDSNKFTTGNCLYYSVPEAQQALNAAGTSQTTDGIIGLNEWNKFNSGNAKWYVGNIQKCATIGMRMPTAYETTTTDATNLYYPNADGAPSFAGASNGVPSHAGGWTWAATAHLNGTATYYYMQWFNASIGGSPHITSAYVRCVMP